MKMKFLTCAALLAISSTTYAQDYAFKVFGSKGNNTANGVPLKIGAKLKDSETITVDGAYLGLSNSEGKTVELTSKGTYKIKELVGQALKNTNSSLTSKYAAFVVNELTKDDGESPTQNRSKYMNKTGSVDRGPDEVIFLPKTTLASSSNDTDDNYKTEYYGNSIAFRWFLKPGINEADRKGYRLLVSDLNETIYFSKDILQGNSAVINLNGEAIKQSTLVIKAVPLNSKDYGDNPSNETLMGKEKGIVVHRIDGERATQIEKDLKEICVNADENINKLIAARYFEENGLFANAMANYEELVKVNPNETKYQKIYNDFLVANRLTKETVETTDVPQVSTK